MLLPIAWLKDYVNINVSIREFIDKLTLSGSNVESIDLTYKNIKNVVLGKIEKIEEHKDADKLVICKINIGSDILQIVTGAKNIKEGDYVPVALVGAELPGELYIEETKLRGVESFGMLCSLEELGYSDNVLNSEMKDGILIIREDDFEFNLKDSLGKSIIELLDIDNEVLEIEITPNRPDCLSIIGLARETSATLKTEINLPEIQIYEETEDIEDYLKKVDIKTKNCNRYYTRVIKDVDIKESPLWMQLRLMDAGMRPVNNIVDIGNYVMLEYGEPIHTFDFDKISGEEIVVRDAKKGEVITTLDSKERNLDDKDIVIADEKEIIAIAGIMGGLDTEISKETKTVLIEGANFNPKNIRMTSKRLNIRSEASARFERGVDPNLSKTAVDRFCQLVEELKVGKIVSGNIDVYKEKRKEKSISVRPKEVNNLLGTNINTDEMIEHLNSLGLKSEIVGEKINTIIPTYRTDLNISQDLIEEIGRLHGFHNIKPEPLKGEMTKGDKPYSRKVSDIVKFTLQGLGYNEVMTYSFISPYSYDKLKIEQDSSLRKNVELLNPLGVEYSVMRTTLMPTMLELLSRNYNRSVKSMYAFEIGNVFIPKELPVKQLPEERKILSLGFYGNDNFYDMKETIDKTLERLGIYNIKYIRENKNPTFHPGRTAKIVKDETIIGILGEVHPDVTEEYDIDTRVYISEIDFTKVIEMTRLEKKFKELPKYPAITRDIALVVNEDVLVGEIEDIISSYGEGLIEEVKLFDIYRGKQLGEELKSVAYSIVYRSNKGTLKDDQVNDIQKNIVNKLEEKLDAKLRE